MLQIPPVSPLPRIDFRTMVPLTDPPDAVTTARSLNRERTVAVLGSAMHQNQRLRPYYQTLQLASGRLSGLGYNILTGGSPGANYYGNLGANPERSFALHVRGWQSVVNRRADGARLYQDFAVLNNGASRTNLLNKTCKILLLAPGGTGTLQEAAVALEAMYHRIQGKPNAPDKIIFIGGEYWRPLLKQLDNMVAWGLVKPERLKGLYDVVDVRPGALGVTAAVERIVRLVTGAENPQLSRFAYRIFLLLKLFVGVLLAIVAKNLHAAFTAGFQRDIGPAFPRLGRQQ